MEGFYRPRQELRDPAHFYGREDELRRLFASIEGMQNVSIVGQRRIGKTWLLRKVYLDDALRRRHLSNPEKYVFVFWDLQAEGRPTPAEFYRALWGVLEDVRARLPGGSTRRRPDPPDFEAALGELVDSLPPDGPRVVLLLDEFSALTRNTALDEGFFNKLRWLIGGPNVSLVTSSFRSLRELCHGGASSSPFFNVFIRFQLRLFSREEAEGFIREPFREAGVEVTAEGVDAMLRLAGPHPCFLSQLSSQVMRDSRGLRLIDRADVEAYALEFNAQVSDDFAYYREHLDGKERALLAAVCRGEAVENPRGPAALGLYDLSLVRHDEEEERLVPFSESFANFAAEMEAADYLLDEMFGGAATKMKGPHFERLLRIRLDSAREIPPDCRYDLQSAIDMLEMRPQDAQKICGRDVLDRLLRIASVGEFGEVVAGAGDPQKSIIDRFGRLWQEGKFPYELYITMNTLRLAGNQGVHPGRHEGFSHDYAFLTLLAAIYLAREIAARYAPTPRTRGTTL